jgi:hypothetical protein
MMRHANGFADPCHSAGSTWLGGRRNAALSMVELSSRVVGIGPSFGRRGERAEVAFRAVSGSPTIARSFPTPRYGQGSTACPGDYLVALPAWLCAVA